MHRYAYCNLLVIAITCWVSFLGFRSKGFEQKYLFWPEAILAWGQPYRLITSGFLHLNGYHLAMNMVSLYFFGPLIERVCGPIQFLTIYLAAIVGGSLISLYVHRYHDYRALGASGGVSRIILAYTLLFPGGSINPYFFLPIRVPAWLFAILYLLASFYGMHRKMDNVGHDAHLAGALVGLYTAAAFHPLSILYHPWWFGGITVGTVLLIIYMARNPMFLPLEGLDFTRAKKRRTGDSGWFSFRSIFNSMGKKQLANPATFDRPDRQIDEILQKISEHGLHSLTKDEHDLLNKTSDKYRRRSERDKPRSGFPL